jgi:exopolyphosphatase/guanosine-5'-triphosphate,3'-diphosphate pyrophosphatase
MDHVGEMRILDSDKVTLRLGQAIDETGDLTQDAVKRTVEALAHMREIIAPYKATTRAVATHAAREARNHKRLLTDIESASGIHVELIDGIEEARLVFLGMRYGLVLNNVACMGVDVGGGSTEIIIARDDDISFVSSVKIGAVTLTDKYFRKGYTESALNDLREHVRSRLAPLAAETRRFPFDKALASSGTAKALAFLHARRFGNGEMKDPNGYTLSRQDLEKLCDEFARLLTPAKIKDATQLDAGRAEIILAGSVVLAELSRLLKIKEWIVTSYGLREGLVADTFYRAYGPRSGELPDIQWHSVLQFAKRLGVNEGHGTQVSRLALRLFDQLAPLVRPGISDEDRDTDVKLLKAAAFLREAGKFLSAPQYHRHSQYLISNSRLPGFTESERLLMGLIARFQRKGLPTADHPDCAELSGPELKRLRVLAAILRLAAALDRTRQGRVADIAVEAQGRNATLVLMHAEATPDVELHKAKLEKAALEKSWDLELKFATRAGGAT